MINLNESSKQEFKFVLFLIILIQIVLGIQGFDVCDDGFVLTSYQQIFNNPEAIEYNFVYYLSSVIGGIWYELFPKGGILWFRLLTVIVNTLKFTIAYQILKRIIPKRIALISSLMLLFINNFGFLTYYHNYLTEVLALTTIYFFMKYFKSNLRFYLIAAGAITTLNVFTRLTNITLFSFILAIPYYNYISKKPLKQSLKPIFHYLLGSVLGLLFIWGLLFSLGHLEIMKRAIFSLVDLGKTEGSTHDIGHLLVFYLHEYKKLFFYGSILIFSTSAFILSYSYFFAKKYLTYIIYLFFFLLFYRLFKSYHTYFIYSIGIIGSLLMIITASDNKILKSLSFIGVLMVLLLPIGSGGGIYSSGYMCLWLSYPLFFYWLYNKAQNILPNKINLSNTSFILKKESLKILTLIFCFSFFTAKFHNISKEAYFDPGSRLDKTYEIKTPLAKGVFTTKRRAKIINEVLIELEKYTDPNDYLLVYDQMPMLHFLTETKPYLYNPWVWIYDNNSFLKKILLAETNIPVYPIVLIQKFKSINNFSKPIPNYLTRDFDLNCNPISLNDSLKHEFMNQFLLRNNYEIIWSNQYFDLYQTEKIHN